MNAATPIPPFDPRAPRNLLYRAMTAFIRTGLGRQFASVVAARVDPHLLRLTHGHLGLGLVYPTALLTTTGARSGATREAAVLYFSDGDDVILLASNWGRAHHPAWYHNLRANPRAVLERNGRRALYSAVEVVDDAERERLYSLADLVHPGYADYRARTNVVGRRVPVMRLHPVLVA